MQQQLYKDLFPGLSSKADPAKELEAIVHEYPYFSAAHFFLLKETSPLSGNYTKLAAKTSLHFNNPFWLNYQLKHNGTVTQPALVDTVPVITETEPVIAENTAPAPEITPVAEETKQISPSPEKKEFLFEPLHTTDYFASQGIKLSDQIQPNDKLGKQLKSFTDWLKTMKKVNPGKVMDTGAAIDITVQNLAEKSNKEQEVITEAMAEVYVQQGKKERAADIYQKLSLQNPAKSAYFAAKIEILKEN